MEREPEYIMDAADMMADPKLALLPPYVLSDLWMAAQARSDDAEATASSRLHPLAKMIE